VSTGTGGGTNRLDSDLATQYARFVPPESQRLLLDGETSEFASFATTLRAAIDTMRQQTAEEAPQPELQESHHRTSRRTDLAHSIDANP